MSDHEKVAARHYVFLCFLTLLNVMNFVDRQLLASFANFIVPDLGLSNTQFGLLTGFAFILFYAAMGLFMGALADLAAPTAPHRGGPRIVERSHRGIGRGARLHLARHPTDVHRDRGVGPHAHVDVDTVRSLPALAAGVRVRLLLHGRADRRRGEPAHRWVPGTRDRLAQLLLCARGSGYFSRGDHGVHARDSAPPHRPGRPRRHSRATEHARHHRDPRPLPARFPPR